MQLASNRGWFDVDSVEAARHDATSLYKFIDSVARPCMSKSHHSYSNSSEEFFSYIVALASATKRHIDSLVARLDSVLLASNPVDFNRQAREIATLRFSWYRLHKFIKPALDAHTLESPYGLVDFLTQRLRQIPGFADVRFAVVHTSDLNYFQLQSAFIRQLADQMSSLIAGAPPFPVGLAIVGIPYSQAGSVFLNTALAHEMGHFSFQRTAIKSDLTQKLAPILMQSSLTSSMIYEEVTRCIDLVLDWLEEIYCDLFALCLAGPAFAFAFIDLLSLGRTVPSTVCTASHPAHALRLREQARLMQTGTFDWWPAICAPGNHYVALLSDSSSMDDSSFSCEGQVPGSVEELAIQCFLSLIDEPRKAVLSLFGNIDSGVAEFLLHREPIQKCLSFGVVPSRLIIAGTAVAPSGLSVLNATYFFYLEQFESLLNRVSTVNKDCLECRSVWADRLEMWTAKALEDITTNGYTFTITH